jgi:flagellar hook protein FlgE
MPVARFLPLSGSTPPSRADLSGASHVALRRIEHRHQRAERPIRRLRQHRRQRSQTIGFKRVDTNFQDYITTSTASTNQPGAVAARPDYVNTVEGTITQTDNALDLAIAGQGFFNVSRPVGETNGATVFRNQPEYTRAGDFSLNKDGYLVNGSGDYLNGWIADGTGTLDQTKTAPIQIGQSGYSPQPTKKAVLAANLPASPDGSAIATQIPITDALGRSQVLNLSWTPVAGSANTWSVAVAQGDGTSLGTATIAFGPGGNPAAPQAVPPASASPPISAPAARRSTSTSAISARPTASPSTPAPPTACAPSRRTAWPPAATTA